SLARVGFRLRRADGAAATAGDLTDIEQRLDLWSGTLTSRFRLDGQPVQVTTAAHPGRDLLAGRWAAPGVRAVRFAIDFAFPYGSTVHTGDTADWSQPDAHTTAVTREGPGEIAWARTLDRDGYAVWAEWQGEGRME